MPLFPFLGKDDFWESGNLPAPWSSERPSIYRFIQSNLRGQDHGLPDEAQDLPDEALVREVQSMGWVAGGLDGAFQHHAEGGNDRARAEALYKVLSEALSKGTEKNLKTLYELLRQDQLIDFIDPLIEVIIEEGRTDRTLPADRLHRLARWLALEAPDRGPVKFGIAMLGLVELEDTDDRPLFQTLGRHEEFTLYAVVSILGRYEDAERELFDLAKHVNGWGRIQIVERFSETQDPEIKAWLLREGFRNSVMYEYLAHTAATAGGLLQELKASDPDEDLLKGAGEILKALTSGGPAEDMDDYSEGAEATKLYLQHLDSRATELNDFLVAKALYEFAANTEADWDSRKANGWTAEHREAVLRLSGGIIARSEWREKAMSGLAGEDETAFWQARQVAEALGIDTWEHSFRRQVSGAGDEWFFLMQTEDLRRIDRVLQLAEDTIPLQEIATGPAEELGLGEDFTHHSAVDFIVQDLGRFPGKGWKLIEAALKSPVIRNRNMAMKALSDWGRERWPADARRVVEEAYRIVPDEEVKADLGRLKEGSPLGQD